MTARRCWTCRWCDRRGPECVWADSHPPLPRWARSYHAVTPLTGHDCACWEEREEKT